MKNYKEVNIGVIGAGTVGAEVIRVIDSAREELVKKTGVLLNVKGIHTRSPDKKSLETLQMYTPERFVGSVNDLYDDPDIQIIVETMGGIDQAKEVISGALKANKSVVTANKDLISTHGEELIEQANASKLALRYEAAVAGGIPIVNAIEKGIVGDTIQEIRGIMNGTCNYMLTQLENGGSYEDILKQAQELGYAESDPKNDVEGIDTAYKLSILIALGFGKHIAIEDINIEGINNLKEIDFQYAKMLGKKIKLLGVVSQVRQKISAYVSPVLLDTSTPMAKTDGALNAIEVIAQNATTFYSGPGAGGKETASAIVSDVMNVARYIRSDAIDVEKYIGKQSYYGPKNYSYDSGLEQLAPDEVHSKSYCRFYISDKPGVIHEMSGIFKKYKVNIDQIQQHTHPEDEKKNLAFVMTLESAKRSQIDEAIEEINKLDCVNQETFVMPILD